MKSSPQAFRRTASSRHLIPVLLILLAMLALLAACTRDRPVVEAVETPTPMGGAPAAEPLAAPAPAEDVPNVGEPEVEESAPVSDTTDGLAPGETGGVTIGEYEVQLGDTLLSIAIEHDSTTDELRRLNYLTSDLIQVGQLLRVPIIPPTPTPAPEPFYHIVQSGESLSEIAQRYGISMVEIMNANLLADANALRAGMQLEIPGYAPQVVSGGEEGSASSASGSVDDGSGPAIHVVQPGQTLTQIAQIYGVTATALANANNIANRNQLRTGQQLVIPGLTARQAEDARAIRHTVKSGESLSGIARQYGVAASDIVRANNLANPNSVYVGQVLIIPQPIAQ